MYSEVFDSDFEQHAQSLELLAFHQRFKAARRDRDMPDATDMPFSDFTSKLPFIMRLSPVGDDVWRYDHYGAGIAAVARIDMTGKTTADFGGVVGDFFQSIYRRARDEARPLFTIHRAVIAAGVHSWERLVLPVRESDGQVGFLVYNRPREFQRDFLKTILDILPDGIIAVRAMRASDTTIGSAAIVSVNPAATRLLDLGEINIDQTSFPDCAREAGVPELWPEVVEVMHSRVQRETKLTICTANGIRHLRARIAPLGDGALLYISDVSDLVRSNMMLESEQSLLEHELQQRESEARRLRVEATADPLTGLLNRRGFFAEVAALDSNGAALALIVADIDHFKSINDRYGHAAGDEALKHVARNMDAALRRHGGFASRFGGEEFIGVMPSGADEAWSVTEQLRVELMIRPVSSQVGPVPLTCSFGIADVRKAKSVDHALQLADEALYLAKNQGRNRTIVADRALAVPLQVARRA